MALLVTPVGILITVALLALYSVYGIWTAINEHSLISALVGGVAIVACVGVALLKAWSRYLVYLLTAVLVGTWAYSLYAAAMAGYFSLFPTSWVLFSLAPGILLVVLSCSCAYIVFRQFRASQPRN